MAVEKKSRSSATVLELSALLFLSFYKSRIVRNQINANQSIIRVFYLYKNVIYCFMMFCVVEIIQIQN